ncbi:MAG: META domain-containing protein [Methanosarcina sp.]
MQKKNTHVSLILVLILGIITVSSFSLGCAEQEQTSPEPAENVTQPTEPLENTSNQSDVMENSSGPVETITNNTSQVSGSLENTSQKSEPAENISQGSKPEKDVSEPIGSAGGSSDQSKPVESNSEQSQPENAPHPSDDDSGEDIANIEWQWVSFEQANSPENKTLVPNPENYTLTFFSDGTYYIIADCNSGSGTYTQDGDDLNLGQAAITLIACGPDSMDTQYLSLLSEVKSADIEDGQLILYTGNANDKMFFTNKNA